VRGYKRSPAPPASRTPNVSLMLSLPWSCSLLAVSGCPLETGALCCDAEYELGDALKVAVGRNILQEACESAQVS
jgi:hypothetical protein